MINEIYENLISEQSEEEEKIAFFMDRLQEHIDRVKSAAYDIAQAYPEFSELVDQAEEHDASKFEEPEKSPYIELTWAKKLEKETGRKFDSTPEITQATLHHIKNNRHHPEFHLEDKTKANLSSTNRDESIECVDATNMPDLDVAEMVADWQAMSEELGTNTAREWFDDVKDVRWKFSVEQEELIDRLLKVFE
jgi:hypothetical protein